MIYKFMDKTNILVVILLVSNILTVAFFSGKELLIKPKPVLSSFEKAVKDIHKDLHFYENFDTFSALFSEEDYKNFEILEREFSEGGSYEDNLMADMIAEFFVANPKMKEISEKARDIYNKNKPSDKEKEILVQKSDKCAESKQVIEDELAKKYENVGDEREGLDFVFYSPTLETCAYSAGYVKNYKNEQGIYSIEQKEIIYNASTGKMIKEFALESEYDMDDFEPDMGVRDYVKFILENSGYRAELLVNFTYRD
jgi:hypothetical protein